MILIFCILLFIITVAVIVYPLFFQKLTVYKDTDTTKDFNEQDSLLSALSDLEEEFQLGRLSDADYQRLKLHFQRRYLQLKQGTS